MGQRYELERPSVFRGTLLAIGGGIVGFLIIDYLFSGAAAFLGFIVFACIAYILSRR